MTESLEMYLETISLLHERIRIARVTDIAQELGVSKSSVHTALHELERRGYIDHEHYGEIFLTDEGKAASAAIRESHAILTEFFRDVLGVSARTAEDDACRIEHYLSTETLARITGAVKKSRESVSGGVLTGSSQAGSNTDGVQTDGKRLPGSQQPGKTRRPRVNWVAVEPEWKPGPRKPKRKSDT